jgi:hypothetical protein
MKLLTLIGLLLYAGAAEAEAPTPLPPPPTIIINYGTYQGSGQPTVQAAPSPASAAVASVATAHESALTQENELEGLSLAILLGVQSADRENASMLPSVGIAPKLRFLRFLSLEGEAFVSNGKSLSGTSPFSFSGQAVAQLTFHSVLFDFTPKIGAGFTTTKAGKAEYSGSHIMLGAEVGIGRMRFTGEVRGGDRLKSSNTKTIDYSVALSCIDDCSGYGYPSSYTYYSSYSSYYLPKYEEARLGAAYQLGERSKMGVQYNASPVSSQLALFYQFGL